LFSLLFAPCWVLAAERVSPGTGCIGAGSGELLILKEAVSFMPESLRGILDRHWEPMESGLGAQPLLNAAGMVEPPSLEASLRRKMSLIGQMLRSSPKFVNVAREFGGAARLIIYLNLPEVRTLSVEDRDFLMHYIEKNSSNFPLVVYDDPGEWVGSMEGFLDGMRQRRRQLSERLREAYPRRLADYPLETFDARSPLFGICSLIFSHSINDIARAWLWTWRSANGDMSGRPIYPK
jgi:hypothetical protein